MTKSLFSQEEIHSNFENNYYDEYDFMQIKDIKVSWLMNVLIFIGYDVRVTLLGFACSEK